jgi:hypothetical protein
MSYVCPRCGYNSVHDQGHHEEYHIEYLHGRVEEFERMSKFGVEVVTRFLERYGPKKRGPKPKK